MQKNSKQTPFSASNFRFQVLEAEFPLITPAGIGPMQGGSRIFLFGLWCWRGSMIVNVCALGILRA